MVNIYENSTYLVEIKQCSDIDKYISYPVSKSQKSKKYLCTLMR
jgi:hypothetical protein